jgi:hypothetical protein
VTPESGHPPGETGVVLGCQWPLRYPPHRLRG